MTIDPSPTPRIYYPQFYFKQIEMEEFDARSDGKTWGKPWETMGKWMRNFPFKFGCLIIFQRFTMIYLSFEVQDISRLLHETVEFLE